MLFQSVLIFLSGGRFETFVSYLMNIMPWMCCWNFKINSSESVRIVLNVFNSASDPKTQVAELQFLSI